MYKKGVTLHRCNACAKTPQAERLAAFGYEKTELPGVYRSPNIYVAHITLLALNELRDEPHNALVKAFASRSKEKAKAFRLLRRFWKLSAELLLLLKILQAVWALPEGATMSEILTPERVLELGQEWKRLLLSDLPPEELDAYVNPDYKRALLNSGREEGREEGEKLGKLETLAHILQHRLGEMPATVSERLSHCTVNELNALVNPALDATTWAEFLVALPKAAT